MTTTVPTRAPRRLAAFGLLVTTLLLAGCGARIDTLLTIGADGQSGSRVITLTLDKADYDRDDVDATPSDVEASLRKHLPEQLTLTSYTETDDEVQAVLTLSFATLDEYRQKVTALLGEAAQNSPPTLDVQLESSTVLHGAKIEESFTSKELLGWLADGLVADGVVPESYAWRTFTDGTTKVTAADKPYEVNYPRISLDEIDDNGFTAVTMETTPRDDGGWDRSITYVTSVATYERAKGTLDTFFTTAVPDGGAVDGPVTDLLDATWTVTFTAADEAALVAATNQALASQDAQLALTETVDDANPATRQISVLDFATCTSICSPGTTMQSTVTLPASMQGLQGVELPWSANARQNDDGTTTIEQRFSETPEPLVLERRVPFTSIDVHTVLGRGGDVEQTITYVLPTAQAVDAYAGRLDPGENGSFSTSTDDDSTVYVATLRAGDAEALDEILGTYLPGSDIRVDDESTFFTIDKEMRVVVDLSDVAPHGVTEHAEHRLDLPSGYTAELKPSLWGASSASVDGTTVTWPLTVEGSMGSQDGTLDVYASPINLELGGRALAGLVILGVIALLLVAAAVIVTVRRETVVPVVRRMVAQTAAAARANPTGTAAQPGTPDGAGSVPAGPGFTEADLL